MELGAECPRCGGRIGVLNTRVSESGASRLRWLGCIDCGFRPDDNKQVVPIQFAPAQSRRTMLRRNLRR